jgi:hypothetical protein
MGPPRVMVPCHYSSSHWAVSLYKVLIWYLQYFISYAPETIYDRRTDRQDDGEVIHLCRIYLIIKGDTKMCEVLRELLSTQNIFLNYVLLQNIYIFHVEKAILILNMFNYCTCQILLQTELLETPWVMPPSL